MHLYLIKYYLSICKNLSDHLSLKIRMQWRNLDVKQTKMREARFELQLFLLQIHNLINMSVKCPCQKMLVLLYDLNVNCDFCDIYLNQISSKKSRF